MFTVVKTGFFDNIIFMTYNKVLSLQQPLQAFYKKSSVNMYTCILLMNYIDDLGKVA
jgi:hypothetical protein